MAIAIIIPDRDVRPFRDKLLTCLPGGTEVWIYPDIPDASAVTMAVLWKHPPGVLAGFPRLRLASSFGAGVEHILNDPDLPAGVLISRIVDEQLTTGMRNYVLMAVLNIHKQLRFYQAARQERRWAKPEPIEQALRIGVLGLGELGTPIAEALAGLGFPVFGYSQSPKTIPGVRCIHAGEMTISEFAGLVNTLVCLLPRTPATEGLLNRELFRHLPSGSFLINAARGAHLVEADLLHALDHGRLCEAWLDVFQTEPLPADHPFWGHPAITITPHVASITNPDNAALIAADNYRRLQEGLPLRFEVDREKGY